MKFSRVLLIGVVMLVLAGCASVPFERTYSLEYQDGKQAIGASVTLRPIADGKGVVR